jgi:hypothetical protein
MKEKSGGIKLNQLHIRKNNQNKRIQNLSQDDIKHINKQEKIEKRFNKVKSINI